MLSPARNSVIRLRRLAVILEAGDEDERWLANRLARYFADAPRGLTVDMALDLAPTPGAAAWCTDEEIAARDAALRKLAARFWPDRKVASQAYQIERRALRYATSARAPASRVAPSKSQARAPTRGPASLPLAVHEIYLGRASGAGQPAQALSNAGWFGCRHPGMVDAAAAVAPDIAVAASGETKVR